MPLTREILAHVAPEYASEAAVSNERLAFWIQEAGRNVFEADYGARADMAAALWVAHHLKLSDLQGAGAVTSERLGDISRSYAAPDKAGGPLGLTSYGQQLMALRNPMVGFSVMTAEVY